MSTHSLPIAFAFVGILFISTTLHSSRGFLATSSTSSTMSVPILPLEAAGSHPDQASHVAEARHRLAQSHRYVFNQPKAGHPPAAGPRSAPPVGWWAPVSLLLGGVAAVATAVRCRSSAGSGLLAPLGSVAAGGEGGAWAVATATGEAVRVSRTQRILTELSARQGQQVGGAGGATTYEALQRADRAWRALREAPAGPAAGPAPQFVVQRGQPLGAAPTFDVVVCGGTLGILAACVLQQKGLRVAVVEQGVLRGRDQEWNVSRAEMEELVEVGALSQAEVDEVIVIDFNPMRCGFHGGPDIFVRDVLNLGVSPARLLTFLRARFERAGGTVMERTALKGVEVHPDGVALAVETGGQPATVTGRLVLDCMGFASPIVRQARWGTKPDGVCLVVGTLGRGYPAERNTSGDLIATSSNIHSDANGTLQGQYFWEAFPASTGPTDRTTYMFTYLDASPHRRPLEEMFENYWDLLPGYQNVRLEDIEIQRCLFGFFPTYRNSPLTPVVDRVLQIGDASGVQSPLSFGGFGAMIRHLSRLTQGISGVLQADALDAGTLRSLNPYLPNLSASWLFQRAMSVPLGARPQVDSINRLLSTNFGVMSRLGDPVLKPFLQDVVQFPALFQTLIGMVTNDPVFAVAVLFQLGPGAVADWLRHFIALGTYDALHRGARGPVEALARAPALTEQQRLQLQLLLAGWQYGSGNDYTSARKNKAAGS